MANVNINGLSALSGNAALGDLLALWDLTAASPQTRKATLTQVFAALSDPDFTTLKVGTGAAISKILTGTAAITVTSLAADSEDTQTATISGAATNDHVVITPQAAPTAGLTFIAWISATNTLSVKVRNHTASPVSATTNFDVLVMRG